MTQPAPKTITCRDGLPEAPFASVLPRASIRTLSPEEVADAGREGVDVSAIVTRYDGRQVATYARKDGQWYWTTSRTAIASGLFDRAHDVHPADDEMAAALDRVREYWRLVAERDEAARRVALSLNLALGFARDHAAAFAKIADTLPVDSEAAAAVRSDSASMSIPIRDIERLLNTYKHHGDVVDPASRR